MIIKLIKFFSYSLIFGIIISFLELLGIGVLVTVTVSYLVNGEVPDILTLALSKFFNSATPTTIAISIILLFIIKGIITAVLQFAIGLNMYFLRGFIMNQTLSHYINQKYDVYQELYSEEALLSLTTDIQELMLRLIRPAVNLIIDGTVFIIMFLFEVYL